MKLKALILQMFKTKIAILYTNNFTNEQQESRQDIIPLDIFGHTNFRNEAHSSVARFYMATNAAANYKPSPADSLKLEKYGDLRLLL